MSVSQAEFKASLFPLTVLQLQDDNLDNLSLQLKETLKAAADFFYRAPIIVNIEKIRNQKLNFKQLKKTIEKNYFVFFTFFFNLRPFSFLFCFEDNPL